MRPSDSGTPTGVCTARPSMATLARCMRWPGVRMDACSPVATSRARFGCGSGSRPGRLASASWDGTVKLWEVGETGSRRYLQTLVGHTDKVHCVAWSPDGGTLASGSFDHTIWLWDGKAGSARAALLGHSAVVNDLAFTPDSRSLLSGSGDGTLRLWDVERGESLRVIQGYTASLLDLDWSPDGTQLVSGGSDTLVTLWDVASGTLLGVLRGHRWSVYGGALSP